jgi:multiple sugar transport system substrate-binding protein
MGLYTRRRFLHMAGIGATGLAAVACGATAPTSTPTHGSTKNVSGNLEAWDWSDSPDTYGVQQQTEFYGKYFPSLHSNLHFSYTMYGYTDLLQKLTVAWRGGDVPDVARAAIAWSPQFVNQGLTAEISLSDLGLSTSDFWPGALQSVRKNGAGSGPLYGIPANNEAMLLLYNKDIFSAAGLDPSHGPATWEDLASYSNTIHQKTGKYGYGMVAVQNNGNTPFRFCPQMWAYGGSIFDELKPNPTWRKIGIDAQGTVAALALWDRMYNVDKSVQPSALSDKQTDVATLFQQGKVAMMIDHPNAAEQIHQEAPNINLGGDLIPAGPVRRAVVFGGSNLHIRTTTNNMDAALAYIKAYLAPGWNTRLSGLGSNPGNRQGFNSPEEKDRDKLLLFNDVTLKMMSYGVNPPLVAQGAQIWNAIIPTMIQNVLLKKLSPKDAAKDAAAGIKQIMAS